MKIKKILTMMLMTIMLIACGKKEGVALLNNNANVSAEYVDNTYMDLQIIGLKKVREEGVFNIEKTLNAIKEVDFKDVDKKIFNEKLDFDRLN